MDELYELLEDTRFRLGIRLQGAEDWDARIEYIKELIEQVPNPYSKEGLQ